jgi:uncharacterized protein (TIGR03083 family)
VAMIIAAHDPELRIPTCPDWSLRQLATHLGRAHRWAAVITSTRSAAFIPFRQVPDGRLPDDPADRPRWLRAGARRLIDAVQTADGSMVWSFYGPVPALFWARRMAHESLVHRADAELAIGLVPQIESAVAADAIDEWLTVMSRGDADGPDPRAEALPAGAVMHVHATDDALDGNGEWIVRHGEGGVTVEAGHAKGDVAISGPASGLLLVLMRRSPVSDPTVIVHGDESILSSWLAGTAF